MKRCFNYITTRELGNNSFLGGEDRAISPEAKPIQTLKINNIVYLKMPLTSFERMELLGKAARVFLGIQQSRECGTIAGRQNCLSAEAGAEARVVLPPKIRETFAVPEGQKRLEREAWQRYLTILY